MFIQKRVHLKGEGKNVQSSVSWPKRVICLFLVPKTIFFSKNYPVFRDFAWRARIERNIIVCVCCLVCLTIRYIELIYNSFNKLMRSLALLWAFYYVVFYVCFFVHWVHFCKSIFSKKLKISLCVRFPFKISGFSASTFDLGPPVIV